MPNDPELDLATSIAQTQLTLQVAIFGDLDARDAGLLVVVATLVAGELAEQGALGHHWWFGLPGFALITLLCLVAFTTRLSEGPTLPALNDPAEAWTSFRRAAYRRLQQAVTRNQNRIRQKRRLLLWVSVLIVANVAASWALGAWLR